MIRWQTLAGIIIICVGLGAFWATSPTPTSTAAFFAGLAVVAGVLAVGLYVALGEGN